jgi:hypothetical protein
MVYQVDSHWSISPACDILAQRKSPWPSSVRSSRRRERARTRRRRDCPLRSGCRRRDVLLRLVCILTAGLATNIGATHVVVSASLGLCTDAYTTCCWEQLSQTEQKRLVDAVAEGFALGDARGANPTLTMSHLPLHRSSLASRMFAGVKQLCGMSTALGQLSPGSRVSLGRCDELVRRGGHASWPAVSNLARASLQADIVAEIGLPYPSALGLRRRSRRGQREGDVPKEKKRKVR